MSFAFFKHKSFWLTVAHFAVASASIGASVMFPASIPLIIGTQALVNGIIPSPISLKPSPVIYQKMVSNPFLPPAKLPITGDKPIP